MAQRYGSGVLGVRFRVGDGQVIHVTGHFFTQPGQAPEVASAGRAFEQLSSNVAAEKQADKLAPAAALYNVAPKRTVAMQSAPAPASPPVAAAERARRGVRGAGEEGARARRSGAYSHVRDDEGNEGWVPTDAL